ncbi:MULTISPECIES: DUF5317 family protein [unclassified Fusibacter]|uniref:DUF5317 family protein n=1 Tax=unclassified Fusibacter TaxID=2624464 RepID=UPI001013A164|nr:MULTISPECIES: DUF5317 family protein [unclassified Fusibacter]MCK8059432.1 DUF5317 domain-containing protein [Fusibacter sp. A2]NPE21104.1 DUF5317 domain-containing protein [Fusibacter sp. A1]RXV62374.1 hypothetical protein DWB64_04660 [Fusibacter sp. A1]
MLVETVILAVIWLFITRNKHKFKFDEFKGLPWLWASIITEQSAQLLIDFGVFRVVEYTFFIHLGIYGLLFIFIAYNIKSFKSLGITGVGILLNAVVVFSNNGYMPVSDQLAVKYGYDLTLESLNRFEIFGHALISSSTKLSVLSDWISIGPPYPFPKTLSIGDLIIDIGIIVLAYSLSKSVESVEISEVENVV